MACYHPIPAAQDKPGAPLRINPPLGEATLEIPCSTCLGCKTDHATELAARAVHEAREFEHNSFITLTYDQEHLPTNGELKRKDLTDFLKRLRKAHGYHQIRKNRADPKLHRDVQRNLRYLGSGEYGDQNGRPHYHLCLFNCDFADKHRVEGGYYESDRLRQLWPFGQNRIGELTAASANYCAQYTLKKIGATHCDADGVVKTPPFLAISTKPALGTEWIKKYKQDLQHGYLIREGYKTKVPRSYKRVIAKTDPLLAEKISWEQYRGRKAPHQRDNLAAAEVIHQARKQLLENRKL